MVAAAATRAGSNSPTSADSAQLGVGRQRTDDQLVPVERDPAQLVESPDVEDPIRGRSQLAADLDQQVGAAGHGPPDRPILGQQAVGIGQGGRALDGRLGRHRSALDLGRAGCCSALGGQDDGVDDLRVAGAAAQVAGDRLADGILVSARRRRPGTPDRP